MFAKANKERKMDKKNTLITVLSGILACALVAILLLGLYIGGVFGKKSNDNVSANPSTEGKRLEVKEGMTLNEFRAYLMTKQVNGFTIISTKYDEDGVVTETNEIYATYDGSLQITYDKDGNIKEYSFRLIEDGRSYEKRYSTDGEEDNNLFRVVDLEGAEIVRIGSMFADGQKTYLEFGLLAVSQGYGFSAEGSGDSLEYVFDVKEDEVTIEVPSRRTKLVIKNFNKTKIPVLDDYKDYKTACAEEDVVKLGKYVKETNNGEEYYVFNGFNDIFYRGTYEVLVLPDVATYKMKSHIDGIAVTGIRCTDYVRKNLFVPQTVQKIEGYFLSQLKQITFDGTLEQWNAVQITENALQDVQFDIKVVCTDGETVISPKEANA